MEKRLHYRVVEADLPCSIRTILKRRLGLSEHQIRSAKFRPDGICVNGSRVRITQPAAIHDRVDVLLEAAEDGSSHMEGTAGQIHILYEDEDLLLVNKPGGVPVHPGHGHYADTLANYVLYYYRQQGISVTVRAVGRLDKETSGAVVFAKNKAAGARLTKETVKKEYLALVWGHLEEKQGTIELPIGKDERELNKMEISGTGKFARTHYQVAEEFQDTSLVRLKLDTGRTHQIRVHMAALGHPLLGDRIYGKNLAEKKNRAEMREVRAALHCHRICMVQPFTGKQILAEAPLPEDMERLLRLWREDKRRAEIR